MTGGQEVAVWDLATEKSRPLKGDNFSAESLAFSPDGRHVAGLALQAVRGEKEGSWKDAVRIWKATSGERLHEWHTTGYGVAFTPDGKQLRVLHDAKTVRRMALSEK